MNGMALQASSLAAVRPVPIDGRPETRDNRMKQEVNNVAKRK